MPRIGHDPNACGVAAGLCYAVSLLTQRPALRLARKLCGEQ